MQFALVEWLLLAESSLILNTYGSSFAEEAALLHQRPLVSLWHGHLIHQRSILLPFCGHMQFAQAMSQTKLKFAYTEGTVDQRKARIFVFDKNRIFKAREYLLFVPSR